MIISIFIPHGGCPERCSFCNQAVSGGTPVSVNRVAETITKHLSTARPGETVDVAFYGGTFTALSREVQTRYLDAAAEFFDRGVSGVRMATRPDALDEDWLKVLKERYRLKAVELGVQSFNHRVLRALGRSHINEQLERGCALLERLSIPYGFHLLVGCPGEGSWEEERSLTACALKRLMPHFIRVHPLLVLKGTALELQWICGAFQPLSVEEAVERCADLAEDCEKLSIPVVRWGLQPNEFMEAGGQLAGPYHPAFGELVMSSRWRRRLQVLLSTLPTAAPLRVSAPRREWGWVRGHKSSNISWLGSVAPGRSLEIVELALV